MEIVVDSDDGTVASTSINVVRDFTVMFVISTLILHFMF